MECLGRLRIGVEHRERLARIGLSYHIGIQRNSPQERDPHVERSSLATSLPEHIDLVMAVRTLQPTHIFDDADDRHLAIPAKGDGLARIEERHFLGRGNDDGAAELPEQINRRHRLVPGPWREVDQQEIQVLPLHAAEQLIDELVLVRIAPDDGIVGVLQQKRHRRDFEVVGLKRNDPAGGADLKFLAFGAHHFGNIGSMDVHIADADMPPLERETDGDIRGARALPHPAFIAHDEDFVLDPIHPPGHQPATMPFLVFLAALVLVANGARPHVGTGVAGGSAAVADHIEFTRHCVFLSSKSIGPAIRTGYRRRPPVGTPTYSFSEEFCTDIPETPPPAPVVATAGTNASVADTDFFLPKKPALTIPTS